MNELLRILMKTEKITKGEAITIVMEEFEDSGMDAEDTLYNLGLEPDYVFDLLDIVASN